MDADQLDALPSALSQDDRTRILTDVRALLGGGTRLAVWRPDPGGWVHVEGDPLALPAEVPDGPGVQAQTPRLL